MQFNQDNPMFAQLKARADIDQRIRYALAPQRIVWETAFPHSTVENTKVLLLQRPKQISLNREDMCVFTNRGENPAVVLDFGQELHGGIEIAVCQITGALTADFRIRFGESLTEAMSQLREDTNATNDHSIRDLTVTLQKLSMNPVGETGFRFVRIDLLTPNVTVEIRTVKAIAVMRELPYLGSFCCDDPLINRIWNVGAYTVHLNMQQYIFDGIKRDRMVWVGDLHPEIATIQAVFGNQKIIQETLDFAVSETKPGTWMNNIPSYSMWWIIIQYEYYLQYGDREYLKKQLPHLKQVCQMLSAHIGPDGKDTTPEMRFVDWPTKEDSVATDLGIQALHILSAQYAASIWEMFGYEELAAQCRENCKRLRSYPVSVCASKQANALAVLAGILDAKLVNEKSLCISGADGISAFMGYYVLLARGMAGDFAGALALIRTYWGGMLQLGATTFWEDFDIKWLENAAPINRFPAEGETDVHGTYGRHCYQGYRHSLCHGWSSGPTSWLTRYILGVEVLEPGCKKLRIKPNLCDLQWVCGTYPTPAGIVEIEHRRQKDGSVATSVNAPQGIEIVYDGEGRNK